MRFDPHILVEHWQVLANGALMTIAVSGLGVIFGFFAAVPVALMKLARNTPMRLAAGTFIEIVRNVPFLILVFLVHFGLPFTGFRMPAIVSGVVALTIYGAAYYSEVIRAAILSVPRGQLESARAIGMTHLQGLGEIVAPQMVRFLAPPSTNITLLLLKESSVLSTITVPEMTYAALTVQGQTFSPVEVFLAIGVVYWVLTSLVTSAARLYETRKGRRRQSTPRQSNIAAQYLSVDWRGAKP
jgi:polar amino acid transport system permease protein